MDESAGRDEAELARAARAGDRAAFERLISMYQGKAWGYALRQTGDPDLAEDICQEAMLKAFLAIGSYDDRWAFSTWLFKVIHNTFIDHLRRRGARVAEVAMPEEGEPPEAADDAVRRFHERMRAMDRDDWLLKGVARLPPDLRTLVILRDLQGFSYEEIAGITGLAMGTLKSRLNRARRELRGYLLE